MAFLNQSNFSYKMEKVQNQPSKQKYDQQYQCHKIPAVTVHSKLAFSIQIAEFFAFLRHLVYYQERKQWI